MSRQEGVQIWIRNGMKNIISRICSDFADCA